MPRLLLFSLFIFLGYNAHAQTADAIIQKYTQYIGGQKLWKKIKTISANGEYDYGGVKFPFTTYSKAPNLYKFIVPFNGKYYAQAFEGKEGWRIDAFKGETSPTILTGKAARAMANEADVELENVFVRYKTKGHKVVLVGKDTIREKVCYEIGLTRKSGETEAYFFDVETYELVMKEAVSKNTELDGSLMNIYYTDYRLVDGIKIPFREEYKINDQPILTITVEKVLMNSAIADKEFQLIR